MFTCIYVYPHKNSNIFLYTLRNSFIFYSLLFHLHCIVYIPPLYNSLGPFHSIPFLSLPHLSGLNCTLFRSLFLVFSYFSSFLIHDLFIESSLLLSPCPINYLSRPMNNNRDQSKFTRRNHLRDLTKGNRKLEWHRNKLRNEYIDKMKFFASFTGEGRKPVYASCRPANKLRGRNINFRQSVGDQTHHWRSTKFSNQYTTLRRVRNT